MLSTPRSTRPSPTASPRQPPAPFSSTSLTWRSATPASPRRRGSSADQLASRRAGAAAFTLLILHLLDWQDWVTRLPALEHSAGSEAAGACWPAGAGMTEERLLCLRARHPAGRAVSNHGRAIGEEDVSGRRMITGAGAGEGVLCCPGRVFPAARAGLSAVTDEAIGVRGRAGGRGRVARADPRLLGTVPRTRQPAAP